MGTLERAIVIAATAHRGQTDKGGAPYVLHPLRVMMRMSTNQERIAAVLHDVLEDSDVTVDDLRADGFPDAVIDAVALLTKPEAEDYEAYVARVVRNPLALRVKVADLEDNCDLSRIPSPTGKDHARVERYRRALRFIETQVRTNPGIDPG